jgi:hypothetical protein
MWTLSGEIGTGTSQCKIRPWVRWVRHGPVFANVPRGAGHAGTDRLTARRRTLSRVRQSDGTSVALVLVILVVLCGCSDSHTAAPAASVRKAGLRFVAAPRALLAKCHATARAVGYPVPCPTRIPAGLAVGSPVPTGCLDVIGPGCATWRGRVVGTSNVGDEHLVITASPMPLTNYAKLVNGPAWYPQAMVRPLGWVRLAGRRMRSVYVPAATNDGSAFMHHVVLIWSHAGHTYGIGFHNTQGIHRALLLDEELARHIRLVGP